MLVVVDRGNTFRGISLVPKRESANQSKTEGVAMADTQHAESPETTQEVAPNQGPDVVIITGMSGAGRTEAMHTFEDLGYFASITCHLL